MGGRGVSGARAGRVPGPTTCSATPLCEGRGPGSSFRPAVRGRHPRGPGVPARTQARQRSPAPVLGPRHPRRPDVAPGPVPASGKRTRGRTSVSLPPLFITDSSNPSRRPLLSGSPTATPAGAPESSSAHPRGGVAADAGAHLPAPTRARRTTSGPGLLRPPGVKGPGAHCVLTVVGAQC